MKKPRYDFEQPYHDEYLDGIREGRKEMDKYYRDNLPSEEDIIKMLLVGWYRESTPLNRIGKAISDRIMIVIGGGCSCGCGDPLHALEDDMSTEMLASCQEISAK